MAIPVEPPEPSRRAAGAEMEMAKRAPRAAGNARLRTVLPVVPRAVLNVSPLECLLRPHLQLSPLLPRLQ